MILNLTAEMWSFVLVTVVVVLQVGAEEVISPPDDYATIPDTSKQGGSQDGLPDTLEPPAKPLMIMILPTKVNPPEVSPDQSEKNSLEDTKNTKPELPLLLIQLTDNLKKPALPDMTKEEQKPSVPTLTRKKRTLCSKCGGGSHKHRGGYGGGGYGGGGYGGGGYGRGGYGRGGCGPSGCGGGGSCGFNGCGGEGTSFNSAQASAQSSSSSSGGRRK